MPAEGDEAADEDLAPPADGGLLNTKGIAVGDAIAGE